MIYANKLEEVGEFNKENIEVLIKLLSPFAPHLADEIWEKLGNKDSIYLSEWPEYDENNIEDDVVIIAVQINGKVRDEIEVNKEATQEDVEKVAMNSERVKEHLKNQEIKKVIYINGRILSIVV
jgi:leucyl-tRNA synthetase